MPRIVRERILVPGPAGSVGPAGATGATGPQGPAGPAGTGGADVNDSTYIASRRHGPHAHTRGSVHPTLISALVADTGMRHVRMAPFYVPNTCNISEVRFAVAASPVASQIRLALYIAGTSRLPGTLKQDFGLFTIGVNDNVEKFATLSPTMQLIAGNWYIPVLIGEGAGLQISGFTGTSAVYGASSAGIPASGRFILTNHPDLLAPATWTAGGGSLSTFVPRVDFLVV